MRIALNLRIQLLVSSELPPPMAKLIELIEVRKLDFELQGRTACMTSGQWNQHRPLRPCRVPS